MSSKIILNASFRGIDVCPILLQTLYAMETLERMGLIHGDLSPKNVCHRIEIAETKLIDMATCRERDAEVCHCKSKAAV